MCTNQQSSNSLQQQQQTKNMESVLKNATFSNDNTTKEEVEKYYWKIIIILSICLLCHSYLIISVFPYSGFMAIHFIEHVNHENAGSYAGLLASSFMMGRVLTSYHWGKVADTLGRKFVLCVSLGLSTILSLSFGLATSFTSALIIRFFMGLSNGMLGTTKTLVSELAHGNDKLETKGMGVVLGMWGWGFLICPAISGMLSEPIEQYDAYFSSKENTFIYRFLDKYPFVLPNIIGSILCFIAFLLVFFVVEETLVVNSDIYSKEQDLSDNIGKKLLHSFRNLSSIFFSDDDTETNIISNDEESRSLLNKQENVAKYESATVVSSTQNFDVDNHNIVEENPVDIEIVQQITPNRTTAQQIETAEEQQPSSKPTMKSIWSRTPIRRHLLLQWLFSFINVLEDEAFPLFCLSKHAGLCLSEREIGLILSASGLFFALLQYLIYSKIVHAFGLLHSMYIAIGVSLPLVMFIPLSYFFNYGMECGTINIPSFLFLSILLAINRIFANLFFTSVSVAANRLVPTSHRGSMNGLSVLGGSVSKALGPAVAGVLVAFCVSSGLFVSPLFGSFIVFGLIGASGLLVGLLAYQFLNGYDYDNIKNI